MIMAKGHHSTFRIHMTKQQKLNKLQDLYVELSAVMSNDDKGTYPVLLHLQDLINDIQLED